MNGTEVLKFLKSLVRNNNREWFEKNRDKYLQAKGDFEAIVGAVLHEMEDIDPRLRGIDAKKLPFRIFRDVRFSKDKRPYKTNMGAGFSPNGRLVQEPGYYLHIEPGNKSFIAGGFYMPDGSNLAKIRQEIDYNGDSLKKIMNARVFRARFGGFDTFDQLKTAPKGYPKDHPDIEWLRLKSFIVSTPLSDDQVSSRRLVADVVKGFTTIKPLNDYLVEAIS